MLNLKHSVPKKIVLIGASTGGPGQIQKIIDALPQLSNTSIIIAQHMAADFMPSFAKRLQEHNYNQLSIAQNNQALMSSKIYICEGETKIQVKSSELIFKQEKSSLHSYNPNINTLFNSLEILVKDVEIFSVLLTGIGDDGVNGCFNLSQHGVRCITESHQSAIVDGMPARARDTIASIEIDTIDDIVKKISEFCE